VSTSLAGRWRVSVRLQFSTMSCSNSLKDVRDHLWASPWKIRFELGLEMLERNPQPSSTVDVSPAD